MLRTQRRFFALHVFNLAALVVGFVLRNGCSNWDLLLFPVAVVCGLAVAIMGLSAHRKLDGLLGCLVLFLSLLFFPRVLDRCPGGEYPSEWAAVSRLRMINGAEEAYRQGDAGGNYGTLPELVGAGLLDWSFNVTTDGSHYPFYNLKVTISADGGYIAEATPGSKRVGRFGYYCGPDGVVRYSTDIGLSPPNQAGLPVQ